AGPPPSGAPCAPPPVASATSAAQRHAPDAALVVALKGIEIEQLHEGARREAAEARARAARIRAPRIRAAARSHARARRRIARPVRSALPGDRMRPAQPSAIWSGGST